MRTPTEIFDSLPQSEKSLLITILEIEKQYQYISELSKPRIKEISDKIIKEIEAEIKK